MTSLRSLYWDDPGEKATMRPDLATHFTNGCLWLCATHCKMALIRHCDREAAPRIDVQLINQLPFRSRNTSAPHQARVPFHPTSHTSTCAPKTAPTLTTSTKLTKAAILLLPLVALLSLACQRSPVSLQPSASREICPPSQLASQTMLSRYHLRHHQTVTLHFATSLPRLPWTRDPR
jgi:hypothetical protein